MAGTSLSLRPFASFALRVTAAHIVTYWVVGAVSYGLITHKYYVGAQAVPNLRDPQSDFVMRWILPAEIARGILYALALFPLRRAFVEMGRWGGLAIASIMLVVGSVAGISGLIESWVFTTAAHVEVYVATLPEVVIQSLLFGYLMVYLEKRRMLATRPQS